MANPRNDVAYDNIGYDGDTYKTDGTIVFDRTLPNGSVAYGKAVTVTGNKTVGLCQDGDEVKGVVVFVDDDGFCTVQTEGYAKAPLGVSPAVATVGSKIVGALGPSSARGYIRSAAGAGTAFAQAAAADSLKARHEIVDAAVTTAVVFKLD